MAKGKSKFHILVLAQDRSVIFEDEIETGWSINRVSAWIQGKYENRSDLKRVLVKNMEFGRISEFDRV